MREQPDLGKIKIMLGGQVIGTATSGMLTYLDTVEKVEPEHPRDVFKQSWDITGNALIKDGDMPDTLRELMQGPQLFNVKIERPIGKMPRKMKKADRRDPFGKTKWGRKALNYRRRHSIILNDAEIVLTKQDQETLKATITKSLEETPAIRTKISSEDLQRALQRYGDRYHREKILKFSNS